MLTAPENTEAKPKSVFQHPLLYSSSVVGVALLAVSWIMLSRWQENRRIEQKSQEAKMQKQLASDRQAVEHLGGKDLAIRSFYASPGAIHPGETVQLCYDVANATAVTLEPQSNAVWPSHSRCVEVSPSKNTTYTLTITDASGNTRSLPLEVKMR